MQLNQFEIFPKNADLQTCKRVKFGIDPTFHRLHLGHLVPLRVVKMLQEAGHNITIVLGTFTAQLGDPSGQDKTRPVISKEQVEINAANILLQVRQILGDNFSVLFNGDVANGMSVPQLMNILLKFTTTQLLGRDAFQNRLDSGGVVGMHELIVPIMQGWDSVILETELEIGGTDQLFNFQIARKLQESESQKPQACLFVPIISGTDGKKMSKSLGNCIFLDENPDDIFGKCMSISDDVMFEWLPLLTDLKFTNDIHPMRMKKMMAFNIVSQLHGDEAASTAMQTFEHLCQNKGKPEDIPIVDLLPLLDMIVKVRDCSKSEARKLLSGNGVRINGNVANLNSSISSGDIVKIGKRMFCKVR